MQKGQNIWLKLKISLMLDQKIKIYDRINFRKLQLYWEYVIFQKKFIKEELF
jgi:hypothetical protein